MRTIQRFDLAVRHNANLGTVMDRLASIYGGRRLVEEADGGIRCTYQQAAKRVSRWAGGVAAQVEPGDRVVIATPNTYEQFLLCLAVSRAGTIPVPTNPLMKADEVRHVTEDSGATLVIRTANQVDDGEPLRGAIETGPDDLAALFYTSGTTGRPKGVELTQRALVDSSVRGALLPSGIRRDEAVVSLPIAHIMGFITLMGMAAMGIPTYFIPHFRPDTVLDAIEKRRATVFIGVPAMYRLMAEAGAEDRDLKSIRLWASGADAMPTDLAGQFKKMGATATLPVVGNIGEAMFAEGYGLVEVGGGVAAKISPPGMHLGLGESVGFPLPSHKMRVVDDDGNEVAQGAVGELWVTGPGLLKGYWGAHETSDEMISDGWLKTGDLARKGPWGTVMFVGRDKDVIIRGGYTVYSLEVQEALERHPDVLEAAVTGIEDDRLGEVPVAAIRLSDDASESPDEIREWLGEHVAAYKVPARILPVDELPRTGTKKVQRAELRALFETEPV